MIHFACTNCGRKFSVDNEASGKQAVCTKCNTKLRVPGNAPLDSTDIAQARVIKPDKPFCITALRIFAWILAIAVLPAAAITATQATMAAQVITPACATATIALSSAILFAMAFCCDVMHRLDPGESPVSASR